MSSFEDAMTKKSTISIDPSRLQYAAAAAEAAVRTGGYPSAVIAAANAETTFLTHVVSHPERAPAALDSIFLLASITKPIVATAIMRLVEQGRLLLGDPIVKYIPEFGLFGKGGVTAWHILTHTSGLDESGWFREIMFEQRASAGDLVQLACRSVLRYAPGARYEYNTLAFVILGELIERLSGLPYPEYLRREIFAPLGMRDTMFAPQGTQQARAMPVYGSDDDFAARLAYFTSVAAPGGGLWSTAADLVVFGQALLRGGLSNGYHLLAPASIEAMTQLRTAGMTETRDDGSVVPALYGLGWGKPAPNGPTLAASRAYRHGGVTGTQLLIDPDWDLVVVFLTNCWGIDGGAPNLVANAIYGALRHGSALALS
jgi:CubicO group peptidase (beta-lactamase class C family)